MPYDDAPRPPLDMAAHGSSDARVGRSVVVGNFIASAELAAAAAAEALSRSTSRQDNARSSWQSGRRAGGAVGPCLPLALHLSPARSVTSAAAAGRRIGRPRRQSDEAATASVARSRRRVASGARRN